jgi:hypothetical protein
MNSASVEHRTDARQSRRAGKGAEYKLAPDLDVNVDIVFEDGQTDAHMSDNTGFASAAVPPSAATRMCAAVIDPLERSGTEADAELLDKILTCMLDRMAGTTGTSAPLSRAIASTVLPSFSSSKHREQIIRFAVYVLAGKDKPSALLILCSCTAALLSLSPNDQVAKDACELIRSGVGDPNYTARKRAQFLISLAVEHNWTPVVGSVGWPAATWASYLAILDACEDTASHLVNAAWELLPSPRYYAYIHTYIHVYICTCMCMYLHTCVRMRHRTC